MNRVSLVGFGYWGRVLYKNLKKLNYEVDVFDPFVKDHTFLEDNDRFVSSIDELNNTNVIIATPCSKHYDLVEFFLNKHYNVFCEKPLSETLESTKKLYEIEKNNNSYLFVDWSFLHNEAILYIKNLVDTKKLGLPITINMKRLNKGPVRTDVNARYDLMSHDISIILFLLGTYPSTSKFIDYKRNFKSLNNDSCIGVLSFNTTACTLESSWEYPYKVRDCIFEFEKGVLEWDDLTDSIFIDKVKIPFKSKCTPVINSLTSFFNKEENLIQKQITLKIAELIEQ